MEKLIVKVETMTTEQVKESIGKLWDDFQDGSDIVIDALFSVLMNRLPKAEFVEFCDEYDC